MALEITPARSFGEVGEFIDLPFRLHAGTTWVPPLKLERRWFLHRRFGTYAKRVDFELYLARRDGRVVGRISAHIDHAYNTHQKARWGWFGFFECEDDPEAAAALLQAAQAWVAQRGMERIVGPADFTMNDESGLVVEGNELRPMIREPWHPPYYQELVEGAGMAKVVDLFMWNIELDARENAMLPILEDLARQARDNGVTVRRMTRRGLRKDLDVFAQIYNRAWRRNWGFVPFGPEDLDTYAQEMQLAFAHDWFMVAEQNGEDIAAAITIPDLNQALAKMNGKLLPLGWWHFLRRNSYIDRVRVGFLGVRPEYQHTGAAAALYIEHFETAARHKLIKGGETGWILETNSAMNRGMEAMGGHVIKRYRMYERVIEEVSGADPGTVEA